MCVYTHMSKTCKIYFNLGQFKDRESSEALGFSA